MLLLLFLLFQEEMALREVMKLGAWPLKQVLDIQHGPGKLTFENGDHVEGVLCPFPRLPRHICMQTAGAHSRRRAHREYHRYFLIPVLRNRTHASAGFQGHGTTGRVQMASGVAHVQMVLFTPDRF